MREHALPFMHELHLTTGEAVNLSVRREDEIVYVERTSSGRSLMRVVNIVGARAAAHHCGRQAVPSGGRSRGLKSYAQRTHLPQFTRNTLTNAGALEKELERIRRNGYAVDNEEAELGVRCIAPGVRDDAGTLVAGLSVSAPAARMKSVWSSLVRDTAEKISRAIGYRG